ncbi:hypothetical protein K488DRAFT_73547 [Vararia minispora EC-137]|uniref:Uncharacterized protein n=1 Tax=Vararia minispora EC-137 TaxID=1314806 RepID=A0ACB8QA93_9AGAM|nr:hypothetical protein K488DRAFT_73547 [Vararia minispora EC-137]
MGALYSYESRHSLIPAANLKRQSTDSESADVKRQKLDPFAGHLTLPGHGRSRFIPRAQSSRHKLCGPRGLHAPGSAPALLNFDFTPPGFPFSASVMRSLPLENQCIVENASSPIQAPTITTLSPQMESHGFVDLIPATRAVDEDLSDYVECLNLDAPTGVNASQYHRLQSEGTSDPLRAHTSSPRPVLGRHASSEVTDPSARPDLGFAPPLPSTATAADLAPAMTTTFVPTTSAALRNDNIKDDVKAPTTYSMEVSTDRMDCLQDEIWRLEVHIEQEIQLLNKRLQAVESQLSGTQTQFKNAGSTLHTPRLRDPKGKGKAVDEEKQGSADIDAYFVHDSHVTVVEEALRVLSRLKVHLHTFNY